ncbi:MAG: formylglycine-generating enzyme family protein [Candidatus Electrothrix sp. AUS4]|nr:formylglycine-generating enzyme family protein [Candidatus Electrothrix sp. AUS4]
MLCPGPRPVPCYSRPRWALLMVCAGSSLPGTSLGKGGVSFSPVVREALEKGFFTRFDQGQQEVILKHILAELEKTKDRELGDQAEIEGRLAYLAWQKYYQLLNLYLKPDQALKGLAALEGTPLELSLKASLEGVNPIPLRERLERSKDSLQRLARLFGKRSGLSLLKRYSLSWLQWGGAVLVFLSLLTASGLGIQQWQGAGQGRARLSVLAEQGGGTGWVGVEESGSTPQKRSSIDGLLRLPVEKRLPLRKEWQLVFYDQNLQPAYTVDLGPINENQLVRLGYEEVALRGKTGELVVTDKQRNVFRGAEVTLRSSLFTVTAPADRFLMLPVGQYEIQVENCSGIGLDCWQVVTVQAENKEVVDLDRFREPSIGIEFVSIPEGCFQMGSPSDEKDRDDDEGPVHEVCVDGFWMGKYEVTQGQWKQIMGENPARFKKGDKYPVEQVSWEDVQKFIGELNKRAGKKYRLPTEAEWEYAARAGTDTARFWGDSPDDACRYANVYDQTSKKENDFSWTHHNCDDGYAETAPVGSFQGNSFGLHDMLGNVWEWCADWYESEYYKGSSKDNPIGPLSGSIRVIRGGSWNFYPGSVRSAIRNWYAPDDRDDYLGFRLALPGQQGR